jgi:exodeoxyribonuclease VII small subunit
MSARKKSDLTYAQASAELEEILDAIESGTADVDVLSEKVERAAELIRYCRETLAGTELRVRKVVEDLAQPESPAESEED